jgi:hypothetical protein
MQGPGTDNPVSRKAAKLAKLEKFAKKNTDSGFPFLRAFASEIRNVSS